MARWSVEQVLGHAPDAGSRKAALKLASIGPWSEVGSTESLVWGKCQGSGKKAYQVVCDLHAPAFKCSCPSRKFPCKHGLALLILWARNDGSIDDVESVADFAAEWAGERAGRAEAKAKKAAAKAEKAATETADPRAAAKRVAERSKKMDGGLVEFERWLLDLVRQGLAAAHQQPYSFWDGAAARLVDGQMPALANEVRETGGRIHALTDWPDHLLGELSRWYLMVQAWQRRDQLPEPLLADLRAALGWSYQSEEVLAGGVSSGRWQVLGMVSAESQRIRSQRTWLQNVESGATHLVLDFAAVGGVLRTAHLVGSIVDVELARYPGNEPARVLFAGEPHVVAVEPVLGNAVDVKTALATVSEQLAANPWLRRHPVVLAEMNVVAPAKQNGQHFAVDEAGLGFPLATTTDTARLLATTGGGATTLFGELENGEIHVATVVGDDGLVSL